MRELTAREFRSEWTKLTKDVVKVTSRGRTIGHWVPGDNPLRWGDDETDVPQDAQQPSGPKVDEDWSKRPVTAAPKKSK